MTRASVTFPRLSLAVAAGVIASLAPAGIAHARAHGCVPVRIEENQGALPVPWREALEALVQATAQEGLPWSCTGGTVAIVLDGHGGAVLTLTDAQGRKVSRPVPSPDEIVPTGEALLAVPGEERPPPSPPPPVEAPPPPPSIEAHPAAHLPLPPAEPRLLIEALGGARVSGPGAAGWMTTRIGAVLPIGDWSVGLHARYDVALALPAGAPLGFEMDAVSAGFSFGRRLVRDPFELHVSLDPSLAVVMMEAGREDQIDHPEGARVAFRIGASMRGSFRLAGIFRGIVVVDGEVAPAGLAGWRKIQPSLPTVPAYTTGVLLGVEAVIR